LTRLLQCRRLNEAGAPTDLVIVDVLPILLNENHPVLDSRLAHMSAGEMDRADIDAVVRRDPGQGSLYRDNLLSRLVPVYGHRQVLMSRLVPTMLPNEHRRGGGEFVKALGETAPGSRAAP